MKGLIKFYLCLGFSLLVLPGQAQDQEPLQVETTISEVFWQRLYPEGGWSLYCGYRFDGRGMVQTGGRVIMQHIYPLNWMFKHLDCDSRLQCRNTRNDRYIEMESDLHNLYPVWWEINSTLKDYNYGEIENEDWRFDDCDFERKFGTTEPRPIARGNIARAILYMHTEYGLPVNLSTLQLLKGWNRIDPPSAQEKQRNNRIEQIQGKRNPYIDNPALADKSQ